MTCCRGGGRRSVLTFSIGDFPFGRCIHRGIRSCRRTADQHSDMLEANRSIHSRANAVPYQSILRIVVVAEGRMPLSLQFNGAAVWSHITRDVHASRSAQALRVHLGAHPLAIMPAIRGDLVWRRDGGDLGRSASPTVAVRVGVLCP